MRASTPSGRSETSLVEVKVVGLAGTDGSFYDNAVEHAVAPVAIDLDGGYSPALCVGGTLHVALVQVASKEVCALSLFAQEAVELLAGLVGGHRCRLVLVWCCLLLLSLVSFYLRVSTFLRTNGCVTFW
ncbi:hypothetical protein TW95_gp0972 [Pandoravirus inopinatum]|uniref:Uncharacterized protein n=1 Tax=Pandoravirus inopinatum TaxID=1605721 RepID=A0A0B5JA12_9VIRU|nr:hypothetical protein TW95_gp0972 [Pandoravirus inopinatum]AJF97706.1 hypothetical protein [Pandoravirus inopinatum]